MQKKYDDIRYYLDLIPTPNDQIPACIYGGFLVGFLIGGGVYSKEVISEDLVKNFNNKEKTGPQIYLELDGKLTSDMMQNELVKFFDYYVEGENAPYQKDFGEVFFNEYKSPFEVDDSWDNFQKINNKITRSFTNWMISNPDIG
ncbi:MAG: hypothetical protein PSV16_09425 [Flavobacterium sp.]|nr:hypothetical protein [Flavobacterium sp.]